MASAPPRVADDPPAPVSSPARDRAVEEVDRVFRIVKDELGVLVKTSTPTTKLIAGVLSCSFVAHLLLGRWTAPVLALVPEKTVPRVWNVLTSGFYEMNAVSFAVDVLGVLYLGEAPRAHLGHRGVRASSPSRQVSVGVAAFATMYALYVCTRSQFFLFAQFGAFTACSWRSPSRSGSSSPRSACRSRRRWAPRCGCGTSTCRRALFAAGVWSVANGAKHHHIGLWLFAAYGALAAGATCGTSRGCGEAAAATARRRARREARAPPTATTSRSGDDREEFEFAAQFPDACAPAVRFVTDPTHALVFGGKPRGVSSETRSRRRRRRGRGAGADEPPTESAGSAAGGGRAARARGARRASAGGEARNRGELRTNAEHRGVNDLILLSYNTSEGETFAPRFSLTLLYF